MGEAPRLITAAELDEMTPDERAALVQERLVMDLDDLPDAFRQQVVDEAQQLAEARRRSNDA